MPRRNNFSAPQNQPNGGLATGAFAQIAGINARYEMPVDQYTQTVMAVKRGFNCFGHYILPVPVNDRFEKRDAMEHLNQYADDAYQWLSEHAPHRFSWMETMMNASVCTENDRVQNQSEFVIAITFLDERDALLFSDNFFKFSRFMGIAGQEPMPYSKSYNWARQKWDLVVNGLDLSSVQRRALAFDGKKSLPLLDVSTFDNEP